MNIGIVGLGFVGLTLASHLSRNKDHKVYGFEINDDYINLIKNKKAPFHEPGLSDLLKNSIDINFYINNNSKLLDCVFITVGTPIDKLTKKPNLKYIQQAIDSIQDQLKDGAVIFLRSTVAIGLSREIQNNLSQSKRNDLKVCFAPERTIEGAALSELENLPQIFSAKPENIVISKDYLLRMGFSLVQADSLESAEAAKLISNTHRDIKFSSANMFAMICADQNLSYDHIKEISEFKYPRNNLGQAGFVSGPCLSKDAYIIESTLNDRNLSKFVTTGRDIEDSLTSLIATKLDKVKQNKLIFTGLAFKGIPETSDIRDSSVIEILLKIKRSKDNVFIHDFTIKNEELLKLPYSSINTSELYSISPDEYAIFIGNNSEQYNDKTFIEFINKFLDDGGIVFDSWGVTNINHDNIFKIGKML